VFKRFFTLLMVVSLFTVQAHASTMNGLKAAFDEMNYSITVEWDQKDQSFYEAQLKKFMGTVRDLQQKGLTKDQMIDFAKSQVKDQRVAKDLETAFSMISINKMSSEEASKYMMDSMKRAYSNGASWSGDVLVYLAVGLLIVALAVGISGGSSGTSGGGYGGGSSCYNDCYWYDVYCWDSYGSYWCGTDYTCDYVCYY
jgi:Skp family chaperone for outer membrane proteins